MTQETPAQTDGPDGWPSGLPAEPFLEILLARLPADLRDALSALWLVIRGSAQYFASRARSRPVGADLRAELAALGRDLETLSALTKDSAGRGRRNRRTCGSWRSRPRISLGRWPRPSARNSRRSCELTDVAGCATAPRTCAPPRQRNPPWLCGLQADLERSRPRSLPAASTKPALL